MALWIAIAVLVEMRGQPYGQHLQRLQAGMVAFMQAFCTRGDRSPSAPLRRGIGLGAAGLRENCYAVLDGFPQLVGLARRGCGQGLAVYLAEDVRVGHG